IRVMESIWGTKFNVVGGLKINKETNKVFSHKDTIFHGDVVDGKVYQVHGLNQWYVNYNRSYGLDFKVSNFRELWVGWDTKLAYQFGCFINTKSFSAASASFDMIPEDFDILSKKLNGFDSIVANSLHVSIANFGKSVTRNGSKVPSGSGDDWEFLIDVPSITDSVNLYGVEQFEVQVKDIEQVIFELVSKQEVPWQTGDELHNASSKYAPYPLDPS